MKKILSFALVLGVLACNNAANHSQTDDTTIVANVDTAPTIEYVEGDIIMADGKLMVYTNGQWEPVERDITLDNGVVVRTNGDIVNKDGEKIVLQEGTRVSKVGAFFDKTGAAIENAWDATKQGVSNAAEATGDALEKGASATKEGVKTAAEATKEKAKDVGQAIKKGAQKVGDKATEIKEDIKN